MCGGQRQEYTWLARGEQRPGCPELSDPEGRGRACRVSENECARRRRAWGPEMRRDLVRPVGPGAFKCSSLTGKNKAAGIAGNAYNGRTTERGVYRINVASRGFRDPNRVARGHAQTHRPGEPSGEARTRPGAGPLARAASQASGEEMRFLGGGFGTHGRPQQWVREDTTATLRKSRVALYNPGRREASASRLHVQEQPTEDTFACRK